jgi:hypothetical protein
MTYPSSYYLFIKECANVIEPLPILMCTEFPMCTKFLFYHLTCRPHQLSEEDLRYACVIQSFLLVRGG